MIGYERRKVIRLDLTTGFGDRGAFDVLAPAAVASAVRAGHAVSVVVLTLADTDDWLDRDHSISLALRASVRAKDLLFRIAEDQIVLVLPMTAARGVSIVIERVARICDYRFTWGVATAPGDGVGTDQLVDRASRQERAEDVPF
jgi:hypothetical protein